ncbi:uncharacterized protein F5147DRAFT_840405 [Suillus discolor]|uniref:Uncharacterized protein n=1 Tax=Suillus discolor TaxID=1912936 RepID=A0A9P7EVX3_9AGAM|nr:uncharacterized protein F5147DRAFT_840405 [Suillus discolor]KAG2094055.1 hypothetical protein F5147DRAFT_840405 [Suillus discolor]
MSRIIIRTSLKEKKATFTSLWEYPEKRWASKQPPTTIVIRRRRTKSRETLRDERLLLHNVVVTYIAQSDFYTMKLVQIVYFTILAASSVAASVTGVNRAIAPQSITCNGQCESSSTDLDCKQWPGTSPYLVDDGCWACCT